MGFYDTPTQWRKLWWGGGGGQPPPKRTSNSKFVAKKKKFNEGIKLFRVSFILSYQIFKEI